MSSKPKVLFVLTSQSELGDSGKPTGWYLPELAHPYEVLAPHCEIVVASLAGGEAPLDPASVEASKSDSVATDFLKTKGSLWKNTQKLSSFLGHEDEYAAIFYVGGHGPMFDIAPSPTSHALILGFHRQQKLLSAVCHGSAAFAYVKLPSGAALLSGTRVTGFSNAEEEESGMVSLMPFSLEDALNEASGGGFEKAEKVWAEKVVVSMDGRLVTGQNPASAKAVGEKILEALQKGGKL